MKKIFLILWKGNLLTKMNLLKGLDKYCNVAFAPKHSNIMLIWKDIIGLIQEKNHFIAKLAIKHFHSHHSSKVIRQFILVINHMNAKLVINYFPILINSNDMKECIQVKNLLSATLA